MKYQDESKQLNKKGWTRWIQPVRKGYKNMCCDCGLVHEYNFRIKNGKIQFQVKRNERSTGQARRWKKVRGEITIEKPC